MQQMLVKTDESDIYITTDFASTGYRAVENI